MKNETINYLTYNQASDLVEFICDVSILTSAVLTLPIWIVPYLIYKWWR